MPQSERYRRVHVFIKGSTPGGALRVEKDGQKYFLPISCISDAEDLPDYGDADIRIPEWLYQEKFGE